MNGNGSEIRLCGGTACILPMDSFSGLKIKLYVKLNFKKIMNSNGLRLGMMMLFVASLSFVLSSCSDDDEKYVYVCPTHTASVSMGVADGGNIITDKGNVLIPDKSSVGHDLTDGERVFVSCNVLEREDENTYRVRINKYYNLLTKDILRDSEIQGEELGDDPIQVKDAWFGGGYLNVRLGLEYNPSSNTSHLINVIYDDVKSSSDTIFLTLRHNAFADTVHTRMGSATASFNMEDIMAGKDSKVYVLLRWQWYTHHGDVSTWEDGGYYTSSDSEEETDTSEDDGNDITIQ